MFYKYGTVLHSLPNGSRIIHERLDMTDVNSFIDVASLDAKRTICVNMSYLMCLVRYLVTNRTRMVSSLRSFHSIVVVFNHCCLVFLLEWHSSQRAWQWENHISTTNQLANKDALRAVTLVAVHDDTFESVTNVIVKKPTPAADGTLTLMCEHDSALTLIEDCAISGDGSDMSSQRTSFWSADGDQSAKSSPNQKHATPLFPDLWRNAIGDEFFDELIKWHTAATGGGQLQTQLNENFAVSVKDAMPWKTRNSAADREIPWKHRWAATGGIQTHWIWKQDTSGWGQWRIRNFWWRWEQHNSATVRILTLSKNQCGLVSNVANRMKNRINQ